MSRKIKLSDGQLVIQNSDGTPSTVTLLGELVVAGDLEIQGILHGTLYPVNVFMQAVNLTANAIIGSAGITSPATIQGLGHIVHSTVASASNFSYIIQRVRAGVPTNIGTISLLIGNQYADSVIITDGVLLSGDIVQIVNPASPDNAVSGLTITLNALLN